MGQLTFDFDEFVNNPREKADFVQPFPWPSAPLMEPVHSKAINVPKAANLYSVVGKRIELNKERYPTRRGWKTLNNLLSVYRDKRFETVRYLLVDKWGIIRDHAAITSYATNRCKIVPDDFSGKDFIDQVKEQAVQNKCKIIVIHNHPSGEVDPSDEDISITGSFERAFGGFYAGHVILDHGAFGLCLPGRKFETIRFDPQHEDPLVKHTGKAYMGVPLNQLTDEKVSLLRSALQVDGIHSWNNHDWVPVVFANGSGVTQAVHYYRVSEFNRADASQHIVDKTVMIGRQCGAIWAFPLTDNRTVLEPISRIARETAIFRDFYVAGTMGHTITPGGSLTKYLPLDTNYASTFPVRPAVSPEEQEKQVAGDSVFDGTGNNYMEDTTMEKQMPEGKKLNREQHMALVEFLDNCSTQANDVLMRDYAREITGIREFKFLEDFLPHYDNTSWELCREKLQEAHTRELHSYTERFPDEPYHEFTSLPHLLEEGDSVQRTPLDFLASCGNIEDGAMYREVYGKEAPFPQGAVRAVSPQKIALFHEGAALPLCLLDNTPANWANLYTQANNNGINANAGIPAPEEVENLGTGMLHASEERLRNAMSKEWQEGEFRKDCALVQSMAGETGEKYLTQAEEAQRKFAQFPYIPGVEVPPFALEDEGKLTPYSGFAFDKMGEDGKSVILTKWQIGQLKERVTVSNKLYEEMIANAKRAVNREEPQRETITRFEKMMEKDADERRPNTAANFWHNYKILCRQQASNPQEAMEVARAIVRQMPPWEQVKLRHSIKAYEAATKPLVSNPLLKAFVKPRETYNQRILNFYEENVQGLPIKNRSPYNHEAFPIRHGRDTVDTPGKPVDPALKLKIGDTVKLSLQCRTLFGESRKRLPVTTFTVVSASGDFNKIVLLDKTGTTKYTLARDEFIVKTQKLEKKLDRKQRREDRYESMRY
jgi:proteasome lid subunit RPN8/RPN11